MIILDGKQVNETPDPAKHKFIGMFRYENPVGVTKGVVLCGCGQTLWTMEQIRSHYQQGHMDLPQYETLKKETE